jgi:hypothetical protein
MHNQHIDHVTIRSELKYLTGGKCLGTELLEPRSGSNPGKNPRVYVRSGEQPRKHRAGRVRWRFVTRTGVSVPVPTRAEAGYPGTVVDTTLIAAGDGLPPERYCSRGWMTRDGSRPEMDRVQICTVTGYGWMTGGE